MPEPQTIHLRAPVELTAAADGEGAKTPRVSGTVYNGGVMRVAGFGAVTVDLAGLAIPGQVPLLSDHAAELRGILGHGTATVQAGKLHLNGVIPPVTAAARQVVALAQAGLKWAASVGINPRRHERIAPGETVTVNGQRLTAPNTGLMLVRAGDLKEISILVLGADAESTVQIAAKGNRTMPSENTNTDPAGTFKAAWDQPGLGDAERIEARWNGTRWYTTGEDVGPWARAQSAMISAAAGKITYPDFDRIMLVEKCRDAELRAIHAERPKGPAIHSSSHDVDAQMIECAFSRSSGLGSAMIEKSYDARTLEAADRAFRGGLGLQELLLRAARSEGYTGREKITSGNLREILTLALPSPPILAASTISTSGILSNVANKILLDGFTRVPQRWREVATTKQVVDFKTAAFYRLTADLAYEELPPGGSIKSGTLGEESYTGAARTYAKLISLDRTDIINDSLGAFDAARERIGMGAAVKLNKVFWTAWMSAAAGGAFWTAGRGNLVTINAFDDAGIAAAVKAFRNAQAPDGNLLDLEPARLLVPPSLEAAAMRFFAAAEMRNPAAAENTPTANIWERKFKPVCVPQLENEAFTGHSASTWWLLADPAILASAAVLFLNGVESPTVETADVDFDQLGIKIRGYHDFGVMMAEYRASVQNTE